MVSKNAKLTSQPPGKAPHGSPTHQAVPPSRVTRCNIGKYSGLFAPLPILIRTPQFRAFPFPVSNSRSRARIGRHAPRGRAGRRPCAAVRNVLYCMFRVSLRRGPAVNTRRQRYLIINQTLLPTWYSTVLAGKSEPFQDYHPAPYTSTRLQFS